MSITFVCPICNARRTTSGLVAAGQVRCPECESLVELEPEWLAAQGFAEDAPATAAYSRDAHDELVELQSEDIHSEDIHSEDIHSEDIHSEDIHSEELDEGVEILDEDVEILEEDPHALIPLTPASNTAPHIFSVPGAPEPPPFLEGESDEPEGATPVRKMPRDDTDMDMTPMVDVVFQLLIFFMLTAAFALQKSHEIPKPEEESDQPSTQVVQTDIQDNPEFVTVKVDAFNTYRVITVDWDEEAPSEQEMLVWVRKAKNGDNSGRVPTKLIVQANEESLHEKVVAALDAGMAVKMEEIQLMTVTEDE